MIYLYFIINVLFFSKKRFLKPKTKKYLIVNGDHSEDIKKFLEESEVNIVYNRFSRGIEKDSEINLFVLLFTLIKFQFSIKDYIRNYIRFSKPKIIITLIDNDQAFYEIKKVNSDFKTILIQNSFRSTQGDVFYYKDKLKNKGLICDYILTFNNHVGEIYKEFLKGEIFQIGSFRSNNIKIKNSEKKFDLLYISSFKGHDDNEFFIKDRNIKWKDTRAGEYTILKNLKKYLVKNKHIKLTILGCSSLKNLDKEKRFWKKRLDGIDYDFLPRSEKRDTYKIVDQSKVLLSIDSTLGYESIARGNKICVFSRKGDSFPLNSSKFGWPGKIRDKGFFWTNSTEYEELERVLNDTYSIDEKEYFNSKTKDIIPDQIIFDRNNTIFKKIISNLK